MTDGSPAVPRFGVDEPSGPLSYYADDEEETQDQQPSVSVPATGRSDAVPVLGDHSEGNAVFMTSSTSPRLNRRLPFRIDRVQSAPTLMEHEIGLALRDISDQFNNSYVQPQMNQRRRASHPDMNNHHAPGLLNLWQQINRSSLTGSSTSSGSAVSSDGSGRRGSVGPVQRVSVHSVPEEDEEEEAGEREFS